MGDILSKLKTVSLIAGVGILVVACGEKKAETTVDSTTVTTEAPAADAMAAPAATDTTTTDAMAAPAAGTTDAMAAPAADAMAPATTETTTTTTESK